MKVFNFIIVLLIIISFNGISQELEIIQFSQDEIEILSFLFSLENNEYRILLNQNIKYSFFHYLGEIPGIGKPSIFFVEPYLLEFKDIEINLIKIFIELHLFENQMIIDKSNMQIFEFSDDFEKDNSGYLLKEKELLEEQMVAASNHLLELFLLKRKEFLEYYIKRNIITISRIAFNENKDEALLYYYRSDPLGSLDMNAGSRYILLKKVNGEWSIKEILF